MRQLFCKVEEDQTLQGGGQWEGKHLPLLLSFFLSLAYFLPSIFHLFPSASLILARSNELHLCIDNSREESPNAFKMGIICGIKDKTIHKHKRVSFSV